MDPRIPPNPYPFERLGAKFQEHEIGVRAPVEKKGILAEVVAGAAAGPVSAGFWMSVPDGRLLATLAVVFEPKIQISVGDLSASTIHLAATEDVGFGASPVENLLGTAAAPVQIVQAGLRGMVYSPTEEVSGMRATLVLVGPVSGVANAGEGQWVAKARWQALRPMSEIDWAKAKAEMVLLPSRAVQRMGVYAPG